MICDLHSPDTFDTRLGERASANVQPWVWGKISIIVKANNLHAKKTFFSLITLLHLLGFIIVSKTIVSLSFVVGGHQWESRQHEKNIMYEVTFILFII